jgi:hypothetical protein
MPQIEEYDAVVLGSGEAGKYNGGSLNRSERVV